MNERNNDDAREEEGAATATTSSSVEAPEASTTAPPENIDDERLAARDERTSVEPDAPSTRADVLRQLSIVALLVVVMGLLHRYGGVSIGIAYDPAAMLALGFVVLASYTIGHLAEVIRLPHVTGYLFAGMVFGPALAALWPLRLPAPFDHGVLRLDVLAQLAPLETLAVALIALTAGGELDLRGRWNARALLPLLFIPLGAVVAVSVAFVWLVSGPVPDLALPGLELPTHGLLPVGLTFGALVFAASPPVVVAMIVQLRSRGPLTRDVLRLVVLADVLIVLLFGVASIWSAAALGASLGGAQATTYGALALEVATAIGIGGALGSVAALYVRYVGRELLLFVLGIVYLGSLVAGELGIEPLLVFLVAGLVVKNFSRAGHRLIEAVEQLSLPTYVVFFTLAGAKLAVGEVIAVWPFALALVALRLGTLFVSGRFAGWISKADPATQRLAWTGFVPQTGTRLGLMTVAFASLGGGIESLSVLVVASFLLNELLGPVVLHRGLATASEVAERPKPASTPIALALRLDTGPSSLLPWPDVGGTVQWGERRRPASDVLDRALRDLEHDLRNLVLEVDTGPMTELREGNERYLRELRREFLRHHRRLLVRARAVDDAEPGSEPWKAARTELALALRADQAELSERWRGVVLARAAQLMKEPSWSPVELVERLDDLVAAVPTYVEIPWDPTIFEPKARDNVIRRVRRALLRAHQSAARLFGQRLANRQAPLQELARFHLRYQTPTRLETVAALVVAAEQELAARTRQIFDAIVANSDVIASELVETDAAIVPRIEELRELVERELELALDEQERVKRDGTIRTARLLALGLRDVWEEATTYATVEIPVGDRDAKEAEAARRQAVVHIREALPRLRRSSAGEYSLLAMELELMGLEARVKDLLASHTRRLEGELQRRALAQAERAQTALREAGERLDAVVASETSAETMSEVVREVTNSASKIAAEAGRIVRELRDDLLEEAKVTPLLDALAEATAELTTRYDVAAARPQRGEMKLPAPVERVEVPFREVVAEHVDGHVAPQLFRTTREMAEKLQPLVAGLREVERLLAFNVELATAELDVMTGEANVPTEARALLAEVLGGQVERSLVQLEGFRAEAAEWPAQLAAAVHQSVLGVLDDLRGQLVDGKITRAKLDEIRRMASRRRIARRAGQIPRLLRDARAQLTRGVVALLGEARIAKLRVRLGLPTRARPREAVAESFTLAAPVADLPLVYKRLFSAETMEAGDVLTGREDAIALARRVLEAKRVRGRLRSVALVGFDGVGKASVSNAIVRGGRWRSIKRVTLERPLDVAGVEALLRDTADAQLVVLDGLFWMASAEPGGFLPVRRFIDGVVADGGKRAWLLHAEALFWRWAAAVAPLREAFPDIVELEPLTAEELTTAVMERHRLSGYGHAFDRGEGSSLVETLLARGASRIRRPFEHYFLELHAVTGGLIRDALRLWLSSIRSVEGGDIIRVGPVPSAPYLALGRLPEDDLLALFLVARQGWMSSEAFAWLLRAEPTSARAKLARLTHLGLLDERDGYHRVSLHLRGALGLIFARRGWM